MRFYKACPPQIFSFRRHVLRIMSSFSSCAHLTLTDEIDLRTNCAIPTYRHRMALGNGKPNANQSCTSRWLTEKSTTHHQSEMPRDYRPCPRGPSGHTGSSAHACKKARVVGGVKPATNLAGYSTTPPSSLIAPSPGQPCTNGFVASWTTVVNRTAINIVN